MEEVGLTEKMERGKATGLSPPSPDADPARATSPSHCQTAPTCHPSPSLSPATTNSPFRRCRVARSGPSCHQPCPRRQRRPLPPTVAARTRAAAQAPPRLCQHGAQTDAVLTGEPCRPPPRARRPAPPRPLRNRRTPSPTSSPTLSARRCRSSHRPPRGNPVRSAAARARV